MEPNVQQEKNNIGGLFDRIAHSYDGLNHILSLNIDKCWRKQAVKSMQPADHVLDVAIGTADLSIAMLRSGKVKHVTGIDLSKEMMRIGEEKTRKLGYDVTYIYGSAQDMPFETNSFDAVTCSYGCRNFQNLDEGLSEFYRVLQPGGEVIILEFSYPENALVRWVYDLYFSHIMPFFGRLLSHDNTAYTYLNRSVKNFVWGESFAARLRQAGFQDVSYKAQTLGISMLYRATKH